MLLLPVPPPSVGGTMPGTPFELSSSIYYRINSNNQHDHEIYHDTISSTKARLEYNQDTNVRLVPRVDDRLRWLLAAFLRRSIIE